MNVTYLRMARRHFVHDMVPTHTARHNMRSWVRQVRLLGRQWLALPTNSR